MQDEPQMRWLVDSGAYTAAKDVGRWESVNLDSYCKFIAALPVTPWRYLALDVIHDPEGTVKNYRTMLARGFRPMPVFTRGMDFSVLDEFFATSDVVALGGISTKRNPHYMKIVMEHVKGRPVHLLGKTYVDLLKLYRPFSCDSTSWCAGLRYGTIELYTGNGVFRRLHRAHFKKHPPDDVVAAINALGLEPWGLAKPEGWRGVHSLSGKISAASWIKCAMDVEKRLGTFVFLVAVNESMLNVLLPQYERLRAKEVA
jgi:hypothetical protein